MKAASILAQKGHPAPTNRTTSVFDMCGVALLKERLRRISMSNSASDTLSHFALTPE